MFFFFRRKSDTIVSASVVVFCWRLAVYVVHCSPLSWIDTPKFLAEHHLAVRHMRDVTIFGLEPDGFIEIVCISSPSIVVAANQLFQTTLKLLGARNSGFDDCSEHRCSIGPRERGKNNSRACTEFVLSLRTFVTFEESAYS